MWIILSLSSTFFTWNSFDGRYGKLNFSAGLLGARVDLGLDVVVVWDGFAITAAIPWLHEGYSLEANGGRSKTRVDLVDRLFMGRQFPHAGRRKIRHVTCNRTPF